MSRPLCLNCFRIKGDYEMCPYCGYMENDPPKEVFQLKPGTILQSRYIIGESIGYGGFGITYKAYDTILSIVVAVKEFFPAGLVNRAEGEIRVGVFSGNKAEEYEKLKNRFIEEARNLALFAKEKDIVNVFDYFEANGTAYIIMEHVDSPIMKQVIKEKGKLQEQQAVQYICAVLRAIQKIHNQGIIHKDVSPDNIFLISEDQIKIFDFGAAKLKNGNNEKNMSIVVKAGYAPPEQYRSNSRQDIRMDIYAAGAVLYQLLTGEKPAEALDRCEKDTLRSPQQLGITCSDSVNKAVMKAMALNPEERYGSAGEFCIALLTPEKRKKGWKWW